MSFSHVTTKMSLVCQAEEEEKGLLYQPHTALLYERVAGQPAS